MKERTGTMKFIFKIVAAAVVFWGLVLMLVRWSGDTIVGPAFEATLQPPVPPVPEPLVSLLPSDVVYQGEALRVNVATTSIGSISLGSKEYKLFPYQGEMSAVIPFDVDTKTGKSEVKAGGQVIPIEVLTGIFPKEIVKPPKPLTPEEVVTRKKEVKTIGETYAAISPAVYFDSAFVPPLDVIDVTGPFGAQRVAPGTSYRSVHNGVDLRAKLGTPVKAVNDGVVTLAEKYLFEGGFVIIDHGLGINSVYLHLSKVNVANGQKVKKGDVIGLSGSSGESSGPHLHFIIKIDGIAVDPLRFLDLWK